MAAAGGATPPPSPPTSRRRQSHAGGVPAQTQPSTSHSRYGGRSPKFIWAQCHVMALLFALAEIPHPPPLPPTSPRYWGSYTRALLVSKDGRHLFVTPAQGREMSGVMDRF